MQFQLVRDQFQSLQADHEALQAKYTMLQKSHREQEQTLLEMGERLSEKALKVRWGGLCCAFWRLERIRFNVGQPILQVDTYEAQRKQQREKVGVSAGLRQGLSASPAHDLSRLVLTCCASHSNGWTTPRWSSASFANVPLASSAGTCGGMRSFACACVRAK